ncbi:hypothetical protein N9Y27_03975 [Flavobacteriaceae bacterium]|jgi:hypothetical protein|nr:hypothetical protein [Flavobacteriaceae bacterium]CAI8399671.1 MAG: Uncharacterised protein [Formosa sp. Hel3_A1_48]
MSHKAGSYFNSAIYKKAQEIGTLSKHISDYLSTDLAPLCENGQENPNIYFSGDIVQQSISLSTELIKAEESSFSEKKHLHLHTLEWLTYRLFQNCKRLEQSSSNGRDFLLILKKEIKKFKKLQKQWMLTL